METKTDIDVISNDEAVTVAGRTVKHNEFPWRVATNRHPNTDGSRWGWIDKAPGNVCWSDNEKFDHSAAALMVRAHNKWLEDQEPLPIKIIKAKRECEQAKAEFDAISKKYLAAQDQYEAAKAALNGLLAARENT